MTGVIVTMRDIREAHMCSHGARRFFKERGWDWSKFLAQGIPVEQLEATGDALALKVAGVARGRQQ